MEPTDLSRREAFEALSTQSKSAWDEKDYAEAARLFARARALIEEVDPRLRCLQLPSGTLEIVTAEELALIGTDQEGTVFATIRERRSAIAKENTGG